MSAFRILFFIGMMAASVIGQSDVIYPLKYENEGLATRINCQVREPQHFLYSSVTDLWGIMGGQIVLNADVTLLCVGDDRGGKYGLEALKYKVEIANLQIKEDQNKKMESIIREKRGAREFFSKSWTEVKEFFKRVFGRKKKPEVTRASHDDPTEVVKEVPSGEEPSEEEPEDLDMSDYVSLYSAPFQFVQLANGSVPEIRFSENEVDTRVKNFKRHLVDGFSTHLGFNQRRKRVVEKSVIGEHTSDYDVTVNGETASLNDGGGSSEKPEKSTVVVKKTVTEADILQLAPSSAVNDREKMDLKLEQVQVFQEGRMVSSSGISSLLLLPNSEKNNYRIKREDTNDIVSHIQAHTAFDIQLQTRKKRSTARAVRLDKDENESFLPASRIAEAEDHSRSWKLRFLPESDSDIGAIFESLLEHKDKDYDEKLQALFEMVEREVSLELDKEAGSISSTARQILSKEVMQSLCLSRFSVCKDFLQLLALVGGPEAEDVLLSLLSVENGIPTTDARMIADIVSDVSRPSSNFLRELSNIIENGEMDPSILGTICISLGYLASKATHEDNIMVSEIFVTVLRKRQDRCQLDSFLVDILEAIGNLKSNATVSEVLKVSKLCRNNSSIQMACAHALRHSTHIPLVQEWIQNVIAHEDCEIFREIVGSLTDTIQDQEMNPDDVLWPRFGFNDIDNHLKEHLMNSRCPNEDTILYFRRKNNVKANEIARNYFELESEPWDPKPNSRQKRAVWDDLNCHEWAEDSKFVTIQDREEFAADRATYNKRKSCLGFKKLGIKGANAEIYAGVFAGVKEPSDPTKYKLFTKFVSQINFLGQAMEIGSFRFYHQNGKMNAHVKIMGRTRQEFTQDGCTPTDLTYRPLKHVPLFNVNIGIAQLSLGIQISSQLGMITSCPGNEGYQLEPLTSVRVGGEAIGSVPFMRGAVNLGGNFNYKLQFTFTPSPDMCLKGSHGFEPMSISFETYYQFWNQIKDDWGKARTWKPGFLSWNVSQGDMKQWFNDTCIRPSSRPFSNTERELE